MTRKQLWYVVMIGVTVGFSPRNPALGDEPAPNPPKFEVWAYDANNDFIGLDCGPGIRPCNDFSMTDGAPAGGYTIYLKAETRRVNIVSLVPNVNIPQLTFTSTQTNKSGPAILIVVGPDNPADLTIRPTPIPVDINSIEARALNSELYGGAKSRGGRLGVAKLHYWYSEFGSGETIVENTSASGCIIEVGTVTAKYTIQNGTIRKLVVVGNITGFRESSVVVENGNILDLVVGGNILGQVTAPNGFIRDVSVDGFINAPDYQQEYYRGPGIEAKFGIRRLVAGNIENTRIIANLNGSGNIGLLQTTQGFTNGSVISSNLLGSGAGSFGVITGNVITNSDMKFVGDAAEPIILSGGLAAANTISISGSLAGTNAFVSLPNQSRLGGQIIINSKEGLPPNSPDGFWTAPVYVGNGTGGNPIELSPLPYYNQRSVELGGGAVGLVPFALYRADSTYSTFDTEIPQTNGTYLDSGFLSSNLSDLPAVAFYGPVKVVNSANPALRRPFKVEIANATDSDRMDVTHKFQVITDPVSNRVLRLDYVDAANQFLMQGHYILTNNATGERVACDIPGPIVPVNMLAGFDLYIGRDCDGDGVLDRLQILADASLDSNPRDGFLDSCVTNGSFCVADLNGDMVVNDDDFVIFVKAYNNVLDPLGDFTGDWMTDDNDFVIFAAYYNEIELS